MRLRRRRRAAPALAALAVAVARPDKRFGHLVADCTAVAAASERGASSQVDSPRSFRRSRDSNAIGGTFRSTACREELLTRRGPQHVAAVDPNEVVNQRVFPQSESRA